MRGGEGRGQRLSRLLAVQEQKRKLAEWNVMKVEAERRALEAEAVELLQSLGDQSLLHGMFLEAKASALRRNDVQLTKVDARLEEARSALAEAQAMAKRVERAADAAINADRAAAERKQLMMTLDDFLGSRPASLE